ncbi:PH domain-containing protein [Desulfobotulus sp. H1]|uniref:PH domain-containing protein n=1 Tax=Desulfobotulus pelophilus TaxID=2823377 RepID=A0ABT3N5Q7_9BACT|nr:PH domain-containing protein [Desulfobotulus pelophilus]MCW7752785.1 PH domain-containing protein [Desulfobotulus pelophilus]
MPDTFTTFRPAWRHYWAGFTIAAIFFTMSLIMLSFFTGLLKNLTFTTFFAAGILTLVTIIFKRFSWKFTIDSKRISRHKGIIGRNQQSLRIRDLRSLELNQDLFQRILGIGDLAFYSAGSSNAEVRFHGIHHPSFWRDRVDEVMDLLQEQKG